MLIKKSSRRETLVIKKYRYKIDKLNVCIKTYHLRTELNNDKRVKYNNKGKY